MKINRRDSHWHILHRMGFTPGTTNLLFRRMTGSDRKTLRAMKIKDLIEYNYDLRTFSSLPDRVRPKGGLPILPEIRRRIRNAKDARLYAEGCLCCSTQGKIREWLAYAAGNLYIMANLAIPYVHPEPKVALVIHETLPLMEQKQLLEYLLRKTAIPEDVKIQMASTDRAFTSAQDLIAFFEENYPLRDFN